MDAAAGSHVTIFDSTPVRLRRDSGAGDAVFHPLSPIFVVVGRRSRGGWWRNECPPSSREARKFPNGAKNKKKRDSSGDRIRCPLTSLPVDRCQPVPESEPTRRDDPVSQRWAPLLCRGFGFPFLSRCFFVLLTLSRVFPFCPLNRFLSPLGTGGRGVPSSNRARIFRRLFSICAEVTRLAYGLAERRGVGRKLRYAPHVVP